MHSTRVRFALEKRPYVDFSGRWIRKTPAKIRKEWRREKNEGRNEARKKKKEGENGKNKPMYVKNIRIELIFFEGGNREEEASS